MIDGKPLADPSQYLPLRWCRPRRVSARLKQMVDEAIARTTP